MWKCSLHVYVIVPCGKSMGTISIKKADTPDVKNGNQKLIFLSLSALTQEIHGVKTKAFRFVVCDRSDPPSEI